MAGGQHADLAGPRDDGLQFADRGRAVEVRRREGDIARPVLIRPSHGIQAHVRHPTGSPMFPPGPLRFVPWPRRAFVGNARKRNARRLAATTVASGILAAGALALTTSAASASTLGAQGHGTAYSFATDDNAKDLTFNQLLGINDQGVIAGYFGSGAQGHPNKGYVLLPPYGQGNYINENFPGSVQTQVTGLNNRGVTVGFWSNTNMGVGQDANF